MQNEIDFLMHFGSLLDAKLVPSWPQIGPKLELKIDQKSINKHRRVKMQQDAAKMGQDRAIWTNIWGDRIPWHPHLPRSWGRRGR